MAGNKKEGLSFGKLEVTMVAVVFLQSLLIAWFLYLMLDENKLPALVKYMQGGAILFSLLVPVFVLLEGLQDVSITDGFIVPMALYAVMFPLFNSLIAHDNLFLDPTFVIPAVTVGLGFGLIGLGGYNFRRNPAKSFVFTTVGITIIFLSSPMILAGILSLLTGNFPPVHVLHG